MKKILILISMLLVLTSCGTKKNKLKRDIISTLPATVDFVSSIDSIKTIYDTFLVKKGSIMGYELSKRDRRDFDEISNFIDFDIMDINAIEKIGVDVNKLAALSVELEKLETKKKEYCWDNNIYDKETGKVVSTEKKCNSYMTQDAVVNFIFMIPVKNSTAFLKKVNEIVAKYDFLTITDKKDMKVINLNMKSDKLNFNSYLFQKDKYFIWTFTASDDFKVDNALKSYSNTKKLYDSESYNLVRKKLSTSDGLYFLANIEGFIKKHEAFFKKSLDKMPNYRSDERLALISMLKGSKGYKFLASSVSLKSKDLKIKVFGNIIKDSMIAKALDGVIFEKEYIYGIKEKVLSIFSFGLNVTEFYDTLTKTRLKKNIKNGEESINSMLGINLYNDLISQFGGNFNFGIYDALGINPMNHNFVTSFTVKDTKKFSETLVKITDKYSSMITSEKKGGLLIYTLRTPVMVSLYFTIKNKSFIATTSKAYFDKALAVKDINGTIFDIAKKNKFTHQLKDDSLFFLDFYELSKVLENFRMGHKNKIIRQFNTLSISSKLEKDNFSGEFLLKTNSDDNFFIYLSKLYFQKPKAKSSSNSMNSRGTFGGYEVKETTK